VFSLSLPLIFSRENFSLSIAREKNDFHSTARSVQLRALDSVILKRCEQVGLCTYIYAVNRNIFKSNARDNYYRICVHISSL
jgi:hypothetical protein